MTEFEWSESESPTQMLQHMLDYRFSPMQSDHYKPRLACLGLAMVYFLFSKRGFHSKVESDAGGLYPTIIPILENLAFNVDCPQREYGILKKCCSDLSCSNTPVDRLVHYACYGTTRSISSIYYAHHDVGEPSEWAQLLRDIIPHPRLEAPEIVDWFKKFPRKFLTPEILSMASAAARMIKDHYLLDGVRLAILADALEENGLPPDEACEECKGTGEYIYKPRDTSHPCWICKGQKVIPNKILTHLRSPHAHVRGCWALDCVLDRNREVSLRRSRRN